MNLSNCIDLEGWGAQTTAYGVQNVNSPAESQTREVRAAKFPLRTIPWLPSCPDQPVWAVQVWVFQGAVAAQLCFDMKGPDRWSISLGRGCRDQENSRIPVASQRRSLLAPESPSEGESPPPRTQLQKSHTKSEEVSRGTEQGLGTGLVATQLLRGGSLQSHVLCRCPGGRCSPHGSFPLPSTGSFPSLI